MIATADHYLTNVDAITKDAAGDIVFHYLLAVVRCTYESGTPVAADDADDADWFTPAQATVLKQSPSVQAIIDMVKT